MTRVRTFGFTLVLLAASVAFTPSSVANARTKDHAVGRVDPVLTVVGVAKQLGLTVQAREGDEFSLGMSFTGLLATPDSLTRFGVQMHEGARVTAARMAPDRIRIEADEMEPVSSRATATLRVDSKGILSVVKP